VRTIILEVAQSATLVVVALRLIIFRWTCHFVVVGVFTICKSVSYIH
jgi:hypothetical protein